MSADAGRTRETEVAQLEVAQPVVSNTPQHGSTDSSFGGDRGHQDSRTCCCNEQHAQPSLVEQGQLVSVDTLALPLDPCCCSPALQRGAKEQPRGSDPPKLLSPDALVVASSVRIGSSNQDAKVTKAAAANMTAANMTAANMTASAADAETKSRIVNHRRCTSRHARRKRARDNYQAQANSIAPTGDGGQGARTRVVGPVARPLAQNRDHKSFQAACCPEGGGFHNVSVLGGKPKNLCYPGGTLHGSGLQLRAQTVSRFQVVSCKKTQDASEVEFWQLQLQDVEEHYHILEEDTMLLDADTGVCFAMAAMVDVARPEEIVQAAKLLMRVHPTYSNLSGHPDGKLKKIAIAYKKLNPGAGGKRRVGKGMPPGSVPLKQGSAAMYGTRQSKNRAADGGLHNASYKPKEAMSDEEQSEFDTTMKVCATTLSAHMRQAFGRAAAQSMRAAVTNAYLPSVDEQGCASAMAVSHDFVTRNHSDAAISAFFVMWLNGTNRQYFVFPQYGVAVPLRHGMSVLWNPAYLHGTSTAFDGASGGRTALAIINAKQTADAQRLAIRKFNNFL
jgi:hypothetical protein